MIKKVLVYSAKDFEVPFLIEANNEQYEVTYAPERLTSETAMMALGFSTISIFSADIASANVLEKLRDFGVKYICLRSAGYDNINIRAAKDLGIRVANSPGYSPNAIAEHAISLLLSLNRKFILSNQQIKENNFSLTKLVAFDLHKKNVGIIGTGKIGSVLCKILNGFGCTILANDLVTNQVLAKTYGIEYVSLEQLCKTCDVIFICAPLTQDTHHMINADSIEIMKQEAIIVNIARGGIVNTKDILNALDENQIAGYATDVYEKESGVFFYDHSKNSIDDLLLQRLINHSKVLLTPHQAFATREALTNIAETTFYSINCWNENLRSLNELTE